MKKARPLRSTTQPHSLSRGGGIGFPIVGIGASAGGLEAFTQLLKRLPLDTGMGFVLVQHLDPQHASALTQILARATAMPVHEVTNNLRVQPNRVYIIPPNMGLGIANGVLTLRPRVQNRLTPRTIDFFFEALALDRRERAIGVILSGNATDGTLGLEAIKAGGGITFAQDDSAKYDSMPRSAVGAGCVDFTLSPDAIAKELTRIARHPSIAGQTSVSKTAAPPARGSAPTAAASANDPEGKGGYQKILLLLRNHTGVDFSLYKTTTIHRRITRRTVLHKHTTLAAYADFLRGNTKELDALYSDALISVTSFFRNAEAFDVLSRKVFPKLLQQDGDDPLRVWVLGCSTGQEAYSLAMAFTECAEKLSRARKLQVFATDLNNANLDKARHGLYAKSLAQDVSPERLRRFFVEEEGGYRVIKSLRESIVFARQNLISDPPFSRMDLISCRNLMIYLEPSLQKKLLPTFHYALKPGGFLFLGASESVGSFADLFGPVDKKHKIFAKKAALTPSFHLPMRKERSERPASGPSARVALPSGKKPAAMPDSFRVELSAEREADRVTVNQFAPPGVLINADLQILQFRGPTGAYLEPPTGKASFDLLKMAREGLMLPLRAAINEAKLEHKTARKENVSLKQNGKTRFVHVEVVPLKNLKERCYLVLFEDAENAGCAASGVAKFPELAKPVSRQVESRRVLSLERDLADTRDYLQSVEEQQEAANEELQASNEEGQSANEELQSLNEELETSKEELESTNEELTTVNEEMVNRNTELNRLNSDLTNFQASAQLVVVLLGRDLTIRRFSPQAEKQFSLLLSDIGRPFHSIRHDLDLPDLESFIAEVIASVREREREVRDRRGRWYSLRVRPYVTTDNKVDGAVLVLLDIGAGKAAELAVVHARDFAEAIIGTVRDPFLILDAEMRVLKANESFYTAFKVSPAEAVGRTVFEIDRGQWDIPELRKLLLDILPRDSTFNDFEVTHQFKQLGRRTLLLNARTVTQDSGRREKILLGIQDVTERLAVQAALGRSENRYRRLFETAKDGILMLDPVTRKITDANPFILEFLGYTRAQLLEKELWEIGLLHDESASRKAFLTLKHEGFIRYENLPLKTRAGQSREVEFVSNLYRENGQGVIQCNIRDITARKATETALRASEAFSRSIIASSPDCIKVLDFRGNLRSMLRGQELLGIDDLRPFLNKSWLKFWTGADRVAARAALAAGAAGGEGNFVGFFRTPRGEPKWWDVSISPLPDADGRPARLLAVSRDVTERKRAELNLAFLSTLSNELGQATGVDAMMRTVGAKIGAHLWLSACAFVEIDAAAGQLAVTHDWHRKDMPGLVGTYRQEDFLKEEFISLARAGEIVVVQDTATDARTAPEQFVPLKIGAFICAPLIREGQWRFALCLYHSAAHVWREDEIELARELTARIWNRLERLRVVAELRDSEARYRTLFSSIDEGFCVLDVIFDQRLKPVDWIYLEVNPSFSKQTGLQNAAGKSARDLIPDIEEFWFEIYGKVARTGKPIRFVNEVKTLGRWFDLYAFRIGGAGSRRVAVLFNDVTARTRAEAALHDIRSQLAEHAGQLETMVGVRTAQLTATNRRLETSVAIVTQTREEYRSLLQESQFMQKKLRHLARQILTAQEDERRHISRELHDEVVQTLVGINVELTALGAAANLGARPLKTKIARTQRLVEKSVNAVHQFARELRPAVLDDLGLIPALHAYMKIAAARMKVKINLTAFGGVEAMDSAHRTVLYRVVQEALTNVGRHAQASLVDMSITKINGAVRLEVRDNGKSFQVLQTLSAKTNKRLGLLGMRERVEMVGGTVVIESAPGRGTTVRAEIPFNPKDTP